MDGDLRPLPGAPPRLPGCVEAPHHLVYSAHVHALLGNLSPSQKPQLGVAVQLPVHEWLEFRQGLQPQLPQRSRLPGVHNAAGDEDVVARRGRLRRAGDDERAAREGTQRRKCRQQPPQVEAVHIEEEAERLRPPDLRDVVQAPFRTEALVKLCPQRRRHADERPPRHHQVRVRRPVEEALLPQPRQQLLREIRLEAQGG
eukprot:CAMPEP_0175307098 /NCGR_PEP_ID=MMETSP0093-20121207/64590_1 /TAXON_ID=311494 /ORGANISM="Alexandrium monilatum, Strain CCMP3105" /LENGTH=199 /DNA_ID=CAMNT_0016603557 /DNA_START=76 /DNA_END=671 /DNA_ORIENTATION=+